MLGVGNSGQTTANLLREGECVLNLPSSAMAGPVDALAMTTGKRDVSEKRKRMGYRHEPDKFGVAGLTEQPSELVSPPRAAECPVQMECRVVAAHAFGEEGTNATAVEVEVLRAYVEEDLVVPGTHHVDPQGWDPLIMKFCEFFGGATTVHASKLSEGWEMPHRLRPAAPARV